MTAPSHAYTMADYLDVEEMSPMVKHEYVRGDIFAMAGGSIEHAALSTAIGALLVGLLRGGPCRAYSSDLRIRIRDADVATYADASVVCDPIERDPESPTHVLNPRVVVEVLSPSTEAYDRGKKRGYYQQIASLQEYVLVAQDERRVELWRRDANGSWQSSQHVHGQRVPLPSIDGELDVDELYDIAGIC